MRRSLLAVLVLAAATFAAVPVVSQVPTAVAVTAKPIVGAVGDSLLPYVKVTSATNLIVSRGCYGGWSVSDTSVLRIDKNWGWVKRIGVGKSDVICHYAASGVVVGGSLQIRDTARTAVVTPPPSPPPDSTPTTTLPTDSTVLMSSHEPSGMSVLLDRPFSALKEQSWQDMYEISVVQDATAPKSPSGVGQIKFWAGDGPGDSRGQTGKPLPIGYTTFYLSYWLKVSANWQGQESGTNKHIYMWLGGYPGFFTSMEGIGPGALVLTPRYQGTENGAAFKPNLGASAVFSRGAWHRVELLVKANSAAQRNGSVDAWLDGVKIVSYSGVAFMSSGGFWETFQWYPTWGGLGHDTVAADQFEWMDHVYLSGKP